MPPASRLLGMMCALAACGGSHASQHDGASGDDGSLHDAAGDSGTTPTVLGLCVPGNWCWENPVPVGWNLNAVWSPGDPNDIWVSGSGARLAHWNGTTWTLAPIAANALLGGIGGVAANDVWAVGFNTLLHYDGTAWASTNTATGGLNAVWAAATNDVWAAGTGGAWHYNGSTWTKQSGGIYAAVHGSGANNVWIVGPNGAVLHWDGSSLTASMVTGAQFAGVWTSSPTDVWAVDGAGHNIRHYDGSTWTVAHQGDDYLAITGRSTTDIWATGTSGLDTIAVHWDGTSWTADSPPVWGFASGIAIAGASLVTVGGEGTIFQRTGSGWHPLYGEATTAMLRRVWVSSATDAFAVGMTGARTGGTVMRWTGAAWIDQQRTGEFFGVHGTSATDVWLAGDSGVLDHWDGSTWTSPPSGTANKLEAVWAIAPNDVWVVGDLTTLHWNGSAWSTVAPPSAVEYHDVWASAANDVWAVGRSGTVIRWNGTTWTLLPALGTGSADVTSVWGTAANDVWIGTAAGLYHYDGTQIAPANFSGTASILRVWGASTSDIYVATAGSALWHFDGTTWTRVLQGEAPIFGIGGAGGHTWVVGDLGSILEH